jgi:hypothetical protein
MLAIHALSTEDDNKSLASRTTRQSSAVGGQDSPFYEEGGLHEERLVSKVKRHLKTLVVLGVHVGAAILLRSLSFKYFSK